MRRTAQTKAEMLLINAAIATSIGASRITIERDSLILMFPI